MLERLCIGTAQFGLNYGIANRTGRVSAEEVAQIIEAAKKHGLVYFDTAQSYGDSEAQLGQAFAAHHYYPKVISKISPHFQFSDELSLLRCIEGSLNRLQLSSLYGLLLHRLEPLIENRNFLEAISTAKHRGLIQHFGVSVYTPEEALRYVDAPYVDMLQVPCNIFDRRLLDRGFFTHAEDRGKQIFIRSVYLQGLLHLQCDELADKGLARAIPMMDLFQRFLRYYGLTGKVFAAHALLEKFPQAHLVIGIDSLSQLHDNMSIFQGSRIDPQTVTAWWGSLPQVGEEVVDCRRWGLN